jgi:hypothetical protein
MMCHKDMNEQIDEIMDWFDFEKVAKAMEALDWSWASSCEKTPTPPELRVRARGLLKEAVAKKGRRATGGFWAAYEEAEDGVGLSLSFRLEEWAVWDDKEGEGNDEG